MAGAPGGWEYAMRKELKRRREKAMRKERMETFILSFLIFPLLILIFLIDNAKYLHNFIFDDGK
jgi:hypothetical protein